MRKTLGMVTFLLIGCLTLVGCGVGSADTGLDYEGKTYVQVSFNEDIFNCSLGLEGEFETDVTYAIEDAQFDMLHNSGDLYVVEDQAGEAADYYQDNANYRWTVSLFAEDEPEELISPIEITDDELAAICALEGQEQDLSVYLDEIEQQATLIRTSKDGIARGSIELALFEGKWYWRSEIIDESREKDGTWPEYVYPMPDSVQNKIAL